MIECRQKMEDVMIFQTYVVLLVIFVLVILATWHGNVTIFICCSVGGGLLMSLGYVAAQAGRAGHPWTYGNPLLFWGFGFAFGIGAIIGAIAKVVEKR